MFEAMTREVCLTERAVKRCGVWGGAGVAINTSRSPRSVRPAPGCADRSIRMEWQIVVDLLRSVLSHPPISHQLRRNRPIIQREIAEFMERGKKFAGDEQQNAVAGRTIASLHRTIANYISRMLPSLGVDQ